MNLEAAQQTFLVESRDLLAEMEHSLLAIESGEAVEAHIHGIFRAAHTIKGSAGLFGFDDVVEFTHDIESLLDRVRSERMTLDAYLCAVLIDCCDHIRQLLDGIALSAEPSEVLLAAGEALTHLLHEALGIAPPIVDRCTIPFLADAPDPEPPVWSEGDLGVQNPFWHLSLRFSESVLRNGMDPLSFLRYLATLGEIQALETLTHRLPEWASMDPELCYLGFELALRSECDRETLEGVFDFVRDDCELVLLPPHAPLAEYQALLAQQDEAGCDLGAVLLRLGALTGAEFAMCDGELPIAAHAVRAVAAPSEEGILAEPELSELDLFWQSQAETSSSFVVEQEQASSAVNEVNYVRVEARKLDELINLVGELVIRGAGIDLIAHQRVVPELLESSASLLRLIEQLRDSALQLRMVPIGATFSRFRRIVRDVSRELGKDIVLDVQGADTELDKTLVEKMTDPLMHLVRNAIDHGIEAPEVRLARGKPAAGRLSLSAWHDAGNIVIEVADDGGGLDRNKILEKALELELIAPSQVLTDSEIYSLIFEPGFSTASKITRLSGRGVGMDVVRRNITMLRGTIQLESAPCIGTACRIRLPLTLAIIDGFLVEIGDAVFVIPLDMVQECLELTPEAQETLRAQHHIELRGTVLPCISLRQRFAIQGPHGHRPSIVVVQTAGQQVGLLVDRIQGGFQTVIKPLSGVFSTLKGIAGSTILGNGHVALILDIPGLIDQSVRVEASQLGSPAHPQGKNLHV